MFLKKEHFLTICQSENDLHAKKPAEVSYLQVPPKLCSTSLKASGWISTGPEKELLNSAMVKSMAQISSVRAATISAHHKRVRHVALEPE
jgi:hypothetical protein